MIVITITAINSGHRHIHPNRTGIEVMQQAFTIFKTDTAVKFGSVKPSEESAALISRLVSMTACALSTQV
jgi:hypothetical protein